MRRGWVLVGMLTATMTVGGCDDGGGEEGSGGATGTGSTSAPAPTTDDPTSTSTSADASTMSTTDADPTTTDAVTTSTAGDGASSSDGTTAEDDACDNGQLDPGEDEVDCGGPCEACPGSACEGPEDCDGGTCETGSCLGPLEDCSLDDVQQRPGGIGWADSYSVDGRCYCATSFDHNIGGVMVDTPAGPRSVMEVCEAIGPGPGVGDNPIYNDVQCGNGPANDAGDEDWCPGRVDQGEAGCCIAGPLWDLSVFGE